MRSEQQEQNELQYTKEEVAEILQSAGDIFTHQRQWEKNANLIAVIFGMGIAIAAWAAGIASLGGGLILGGLVGTLAVSLWYLFQNMEDGESRKIYGTAAFLSGGILLSLVGYVYGDRLAELLALDAEVPQQIYWTLWYLFLLLMYTNSHIGPLCFFPCDAGYPAASPSLSHSRKISAAYILPRTFSLHTLLPSSSSAGCAFYRVHRFQRSISVLRPEVLL